MLSAILKVDGIFPGPPQLQYCLIEVVSNLASCFILSVVSSSQELKGKHA